MKDYFRRSSSPMLLSGLVLLLLALFSIGGWGLSGPSVTEAKITKNTPISDQEPMLFGGDHPHLKAAIAAQKKHQHRLLAIRDVVGTATGITEDDRPVILVFTKKTLDSWMLPDNLEGVPVQAKVTGEILAMKNPSPPSGLTYSNTSKWPAPIPIGVSTGNEGECSAGTIGARLKDKQGNVYALSNNHVYALENNASLGSNIIQPGRYDTQCAQAGYNYLGTLFARVPINFTAGATNTVDAAIAIVTQPGLLGYGTPPKGYGIPNSQIVLPAVRMAVQKYGRTSSLTKGTIAALNATITVGYESGNAIFTNQIVVRASRGAFIKAGDSGSLLVTNDQYMYPVGLLFAGNSSGSYAFANTIQDVLAAFPGLTIDGKQ
jgi:hypothetical protein